MAVVQERKGKDGKTKYRALVRLKGHPPVSATFDRKTDAKRWGARTEEEIKDGRYFKSAEAKKHTISDLIDRYTEDVLPLRPKNSRNHKIHLTWWKDNIGYYFLSDVNAAMIVECRDKLTKEKTNRGTPKSPATVNRYTATLSHLFNVAIREWEWMEFNPLTRIKKLTESRGRVRFLDEDERDRLLETCKESSEPLLYPLVVLALTTGMRRGEIMGITWKDVDFERKRILLHKTKNNERRAAPLVGPAHVLLKELSKVRRLDNPYVFPGKKADKSAYIRKAWKEALTQAKIEDFRFHDLRHTTASYLAMNGATSPEIAEVLGHKTLEMVKRYAHLSETHTTSVVEKMASKFLG
ncbi:site-specific integrase [Deltaproteobacteria bacterium IMCC39524]|nr:site-specific integrase [Deltaproteobacteria bacterium IMCC39524]